MNELNLPGHQALARYESRRDVGPWEGHPLSWVTGLPSATRGGIFEHACADLLTDHGLLVGHSTVPDYDLMVNGIRIELKASFLGKHGRFQFGGIRDQGYDLALLWGIAPRFERWWLIPKPVLWDMAMNQHGGGGADAGVRYVGWPAARTPEGVGLYEYGLPELAANLATLERVP